jgi:hypothetical protein
MLTIIFSIPLPMRAVLVSYQLKRASARAIKAIMRRNLRPWSKKCGSAAAAAEIVGQQQPSNQRQLEKDRIAIKSLCAAAAVSWNSNKLLPRHVLQARAKKLTVVGLRASFIL